MSTGYGIQSPGFGLDPYGDPYASFIGELSADILSMQFALRASIPQENCKLTVMAIESEVPAVLSEVDSV